MNSNGGFSLIELIIALSIALMLSLAISSISTEQKYTQVQQQALIEVTEKTQLQRSMFQHLLSQIGQFNPYDVNTYGIGENYPINSELGISFGRAPIVFKGDLLMMMDLGSEDRVSKADKLVLQKFSNQVCSGAKYKNAEFKLNPDMQFHIVEELFVDNGALKCRAYDGGYLLGNKDSELSDYSVTLLENVYGLKVMFLIKRLERWQWLSLNDYRDVLESTLGGIYLKAIRIDSLIRSNTSFQFDNSRTSSSDFGEIVDENDGIYSIHTQIVQVPKYSFEY